jgi:uncharacterized damage-inducible protein DinB
MSNLTKFEESIHNHIDEIVELSTDQPENILRWKPSSEEWSIMETLCHVEEVVGYWMNELISVVKDPEMEWGRGLQEEERLKAIAKANERSVEDVRVGVKNTHQVVTNIFKTINNEDLDIEATHRNPKFGTRPMRFLVEHFLVEHLETHENQIRRVLAEFEKQSS